MKTLLLIATLFLSTQALANEASKREKIRQLAKVQGMEQMFQAQIDELKANSGTMAIEFFDKLAKDTGVEASPDDPKVRELFARFSQQLAALHTAKEYMETWTSSYGNDLSEADINNMLNYYRSPVGQRDTHASRSAMRSFTQAIMKEQMTRMTALTENLIKELKAITTK
jgi:hypothetical protein